MALLVEELFHKLEGRSLDSTFGHWDFFHRINPSGYNLLLGSTQPLTEMSTSTIPRGKGGR